MTVALAPGASAGQPDAGLFTSIAFDHSGGTGYWTQVDGTGVLAAGGARSYGAGPTNKATIVANPIGTGYWLVQRNGTVNNYGDAPNLGSFPDKEKYLPEPHIYLSGGIGAATATPDGKGLYGVDSVGDVWTLGTAKSYGDVSHYVHNSYPTGIVSVKNPQNGTVGYWIADSTGGVYSFQLPFHGSMGSNSIYITGMAATVGGNGYCLIDWGGQLTAFGDAASSGCSHAGSYSGSQIFTNIALRPGGGYGLVQENGPVVTTAAVGEGHQPPWHHCRHRCHPQPHK